MMTYWHGLMVSACVLLAACGGSDNTTTDTQQSTGTLSVAISDSPMTGVTAVGLQLGELVMTDGNGIEHRYALGEMNFNLMNYQGADSITVVNGLPLSEGQYQNVYMTVIQGDGNNGCYVEDGQGRHALQVQDGKLPLMNFNISANHQYSYTLEVGLYMGLDRDYDYNYNLSYDYSWSVDNLYMGHLIGEMDPQWIADCETTYAALAPVGGEFTHLAYLYPDTVTSLSQMADVYDAPATGMVAPIAVAPLKQDDDGNWYFGLGYLPEATYRIGYTCLGHLDYPASDDITDGPFVIFADAGAVTIDGGPSGGQATIHVCGMGNGGHHGG
ncbi:DUF4382 domain-containing protein [Shewanella sp. A32]|uniref:DUF4382 domain-containing protein n=1 Tax=Shewanella sp. A32 TaxID=3031327 RepID=UPI0023B8C735|nr:DUF4382 domain-containing protein [Shewanella sp. A32]MDF0535880.1 DUF4382 domain-containing protein [Shewanella sp. A32]